MRFVVGGFVEGRVVLGVTEGLDVVGRRTEDRLGETDRVVGRL